MMVLRTSVAFLASALALLPICRATGTTYVIQPDGLGDYATIQEAILAAGDGDVIELTDGTFTGDGNRDIMVLSRDLTIRSQSGDPMACVIDCEGSARAEHRAFYFEAAVGTGDVTLDGVGIINGYTTAHGGGILIEGADTVVEDCIVAQCTSAGPLTRGGGVCVSSDAQPHFTLCVVTECSAPYGGGIAIYQASGLFEACSFIDNTATTLAGGVYSQSAGGLQLSGCLILNNEAPRIGGIRTHSTTSGAITLDSCDISRNTATYDYAGGINLLSGAIVMGCTFVENTSVFGDGGGVYCSGPDCELTRCIIANSGGGGGIAASAEGNEPDVACCDVYENAGGNYDSIVGDQTGADDNFSLNPEFCDQEAGDYRLFDTSPCLPAASPCGFLVGAYPQGCDSPVEHINWGAIKALYQ